MTGEVPHPDTELFDLLNGRLGSEQVRAVQEHLAACADCSSIAAAVQTLKRAAGEGEKSETPPEGETTNDGGSSNTEASSHPDVHDLACFFYGRPDDPANRATAAHVAICTDCSGMIGEYARAEQAASRYSPAETARGRVPETAWKIIEEWENSSFAKLRPAGELEGCELREELVKLLREKGADITEAAHHALKAARGVDALRDLVPVIILNRTESFAASKCSKRRPANRVSRCSHM